MHEGFAIAVVEEGAAASTHRGSLLVAPPGSLIVINPGEVHTGYPANEIGYTYRAMFPDVTLLQWVVSQMTGRSRDIPHFSTPIIQDRQLAQLICNFHTVLERPASKLKQESLLLETFARLLSQYADYCSVSSSVGREHQAVKQVREYLEAYYAKNLSLERLADIANLSPFYLVRVFSNEVGLPPHAYLTQVRVWRAKKLLSLGWPIAQVASETGFMDQSHLNRQFKRFSGITPGQCRLAYQQ
jgi:AraC-like DNA-binding protein